MTIQELKDEMAQDMLEEAKRDADYEHRMRTDWEFALDQVEKPDCPIERAVTTLKEVVRLLNEYDWNISIDEILDSY